jgi:hypothetical protein
MLATKGRHVRAVVFGRARVIGPYKWEKRGCQL